MTMKNKKKSLIATLFVATCAFSLAGCFTTAHAETNPRDYFNVPSTIQKTAYVGTKTELAPITASEFYAEDFTVTLLDPNGNEVALEGNTFMPTMAGEYTCNYTYTYNKETYAYAYTLTVTVKDGPVFYSEPSFPYAFLAGKAYQLPEVTARDYSSNSSGEEASVVITAKCSGQTVSVTNGTFTPVYDGVGSEVEITYTAENAGKVETFVGTYPILNPFTPGTKKVDTTQLFVSTDFESAKVTEEALTFKATSNAELLYANYMIADETDFVFGFGDKCEAEALTVKYESVENPSVFTTVTYQKGKQVKGTGKVTLNGKTSVDYTFSEKESLVVHYDENKGRFLGTGSNELFKVTEDANGNPFNGFPGELVKVSIAVEGIYGDCDLNIYKVGTQSFNQTNDNIAPKLYRVNDKMEYGLGEIVTLKGAYATDAFDPVSKIKVTIKTKGTVVNDVNGNPIVNVDGKQDISFKADQIGTYTILTSVEDGAGVKSVKDAISTLYVYDYTKPEVSVAGEIAQTVKVGQTVTFPVITAFDAESVNKVRLQLCVIWPTMKMRQIAVDDDNRNECIIENAQFTFDVVGTYRIRIIATDESGNYTRVEYTVVCEA